MREEAVTIYPEPPIHTVIAWDIYEATENLGLGYCWGAALSHAASSLVVLLRGVRLRTGLGCEVNDHGSNTHFQTHPGQLATIVPACGFEQERCAVSVNACSNHFTHKDGMVAFFD